MRAVRSFRSTWPVLVLVAVMLTACGEPRVRTVYKADIPKIIADGPHTLRWTYVGRDGWNRLVLIRFDGERREENDPFYHKIPLRWSEEHWFRVYEESVDIPAGLKPGQDLIWQGGNRFAVVPVSAEPLRLFEYRVTDPQGIVIPADGEAGNRKAPEYFRVPVE